MKLFLDLSSETLSFNGKNAVLNKQLFRCLVYLCQHPGKVVTKDMLLDECWHKRGIVVSDNAVRQCIFRLRRLLLELGVQESIILSVGKTGYRLAEGAIHCINDPTVNTGDAQGDAHLTTPDENQAPASDNIHNYREKRISVRFIAGVVIICLVCFAVTAMIRINNFITTVSYTELLSKDGRTYFSQSPPAFSITTRIAEIEALLKKNNIPVSRSHYIYINNSSERLLNMFVCELKLDNSGNQCLNFTVIGAET